MATETERKFLVRDGSFLDGVVRSTPISQGYICHGHGRTVRIRLAGDRAYITIKGPSRDGGLSRFEWEKEIPVPEAEELLELCDGGRIDKVRHIVPESGGLKFEVDVFHGDNEGLVLAEIELPAADTPFDRPAWLGEEVTGDRRYYNARLLDHPFKEWR